MLTHPSNLIGITSQQVMRLSYAWQITRVDGTILRFTDHNRVVTIDSNEYTPVGGFDSSAYREQDALRESEIQFNGVIQSSYVIEADLIAGRYEEAEVLEYLFDWRVPWAGSIQTTKFWISNLKFNGEVWQASLTDVSRYLRQRVGEVFGRTCPHQLGDSRCGVNLAGFTVSSVRVVGMVDGEKRRIILANSVDLGGGFIDDYFTEGEVEMTSGDNDGLKRDVKLYTQADRRIELQVPFPFIVAPGDTFDIIAGCNKLRTTCIGTFSNIDNNGSFPFIPGNDRVLQTPQT